MAATARKLLSKRCRIDNMRADLAELRPGARGVRRQREGRPEPPAGTFDEQAMSGRGPTLRSMTGIGEAAEQSVPTA